MAGAIFEEREAHVLEGHSSTLAELDPTPVDPSTVPLRRGGKLARPGRRVASYLGSRYIRHYGGVVLHEPPDGGDVPRPGVPQETGAQVRLSGVGGVPGVSLDVPPGQSVAVLGQPAGVAFELLDMAAGLRRPREGSVLVDGVAVGRLGGPGLDRYRASRGLLSPRYPLLPSRSVTENVLAALPAGRADARTRERVAELLELTGAAGPGGTPAGRGNLAEQVPVNELPAERQWRILVARALLPAPRLVLVEDPASGLDNRVATAVWDLLMDMHARFGFTLLVATS